MVLLSDYGRVILEVNEEEIIYKKLFKKYIIKKCDIRSIYYDELTLAILSYDGKVYSLNITNLLFSERKKLEKLHSELNKENILFNFDKKYIANSGLYWLLIFIPRYHNLTWIIILAVLICIYTIEKNKYIGTFYNLDKEEFEVLKNNKVIKIKRKDIEDVKIKKSNWDNVVEIVYEKRKYKIFIRENINYKKLYNKKALTITTND